MTPEPLEPDTVRVRWLPVSASDAGHIPRGRGMLDAEEIAKADRFVFDADRTTYIAAHALVRTMSSLATGAPTEVWRFARCRFGKPRLLGPCNGLRFNLSHTRDFAACAIAYDEIGLDVEASDRRMDFTIANRVFTPEEMRLVDQAPLELRPVLFFRFWTLKEAFIKATGEGLQRPLSSFSFNLDPPQIAFHPKRESTPRNDNPEAWQFYTYLAMPNRPLALAVQRSRNRPVQLDMRAAEPEEVGPH